MVRPEKVVLGPVLLPKKEVDSWMAALLLLRGKSLVEKVLLKYNKEDLKKDDYALLSKALEDWDVEIKKIRDKTEKLIMMK